MGNSIGVTVLPIPGKRSLGIKNRDLKICEAKGSNPVDVIAGDIFQRLLDIHEKSEDNCLAKNICNSVKNVMVDYALEDAVSLELHRNNLTPYMRFTDCSSLFPQCSYRSE